MLRPTRVAEINAAHAQAIKVWLRNHLEAPDEVSVRPDDPSFPAGRFAEDNHVIDLLTLPPGDTKKVVDIDEVLRSADRQRDRVVALPACVDEETNKGRLMARFFLKNIDKLLLQVPVRCSDFFLLPSQRLAILALTTPMPREIHCRLTIPTSAMRELTKPGARKMAMDVRLALPANGLPAFALADYATGSGKTAMALMAALSLLCSAERWTHLQSKYREILSQRLLEPACGLLRGEPVASSKLARMAIVFAPPALVNHWYNTALSCVACLKEVYGRDVEVEVWKGEPSRNGVLRAYESGKVIIGIYKADAEATSILRKSPGVGVAVRIYDELNTPITTRYDSVESPVCFNYIVQATLDLLSGATDGQPRHPLRLAFGGNFVPTTRLVSMIQGGAYKDALYALGCAAKIRLFAAPDFLRRLVSNDVQRNMPGSIAVHRVSLRAATLSAVVTGAAVVRLTLPQLAVAMLNETSGGCTSVSTELRDSIEALFEQAELLGTAEILETLDDKLSGMPETDYACHMKKAAVTRLRRTMEEVLGGELPTCPVTLDTIEKANVRILRCCTAVLDVNSLPVCNGRCPLCRAPLGEGSEVALAAPDAALAASKAAERAEARSKAVLDYDPTQTVLSFGSSGAGAGSSSSSALGKRRAEAEAEAEADDAEYTDDEADGAEQADAGGDAGGDDDEVDDEVDEVIEAEDAIARFEAELARIDAARPQYVDGLMDAIRGQVALRPTSRVLLCFAFERSQASVVRALADRVRREVPGAVVTDLEEVGRNSERAASAIANFCNPATHPSPHVFFLNNAARSSSIQGLDLHTTDLTIVADRCSRGAQRQAAGRSLRMRKRPKGMAPEARFPAKRLIVATVVHSR